MSPGSGGQAGAGGPRPEDVPSLLNEAVSRGLLSPAQANDALRAWREACLKAQPWSLGEYLVTRHVVSGKRWQEFLSREPEPALEVRAPLGPPPSVPPADELLLPCQLGDYRLLEKLGTGGMGTVYRALQVPLGRTVAVKVLASRLASDPAFIERFRREARAAAALNHPNVVLPIDVAEHRGCHYISMEYVEGESLGDLLDREGRLPWRRAVEITRQVAAGLEHAHRRGLVHGDMKPENVLLERDGRLAKITDLGLARRHGAPLEESEGGGFFGTPYYVSPEQARGETALDGRADIYSLGATLWHLLVGVPPFEGPNGAVIMTKHAIEPVPDPRTSVTDCPDGLVAVMAKMMAKKAEDRYANCRQLGEDLDALLAGRLPAHAPPVGKQWARPDLDAAFSIPGSLEGDGSRGAASTSARLSPTGSRVRGPSASHAQGPSGSRARRSGLSSAAAGRSRHRPGRSGSPRAASSALWPWLVAGILALLLLALGLTWLLSAP